MIDNALKIKGYMSEPELRWLAERAAESKVIVEIGSYYGRSARALADNTDGKVICIDPWPGIVPNTFGKIAIASGEYVHRQFRLNLLDHITNGKLQFHRGTVDTVPRELVQDCDFIFIDGGHLHADVLKDVEFAKQIVRTGIISGHDYENADYPAVKQIVDENFTNVGKKGFIWWTRR